MAATAVFAAAHIALQQPIHGLVLSHILINLPGGSALVIGKRKRQRLYKTLCKWLLKRDRQSLFLGAAHV